MGLSIPRADSLEIIYLQTEKRFLGVNPMSLSDPRDKSLEIIYLNPETNC